MTARKELSAPIDFFYKFLALFTHPWFFLFWVALWYYLNDGEYKEFFWYSTIFAALLPGAASVIYLKIKKEEDQFVISRENRHVPNTIYLLCLIGTWYLFLGGIIDAVYPAGFYPIIIIGSVIGFIVNFFWKISLHGMGMGILLVATLFIPDETAMYYFIGTLILTPIVCVSRYQLGSHTPAQLVAGMLMGAGVTGGVIWWVLNQ